MRTWIVLALLLASTASAGSSADPEITDPKGDQAVGGEPSPQGQFSNIDVIAAWIEDDGEGDLLVVIQAGAEIRGGQVNGNPTTKYDFVLHFETDAGAFTAGATVENNPPAFTLIGAASAAERPLPDTLHITVPRDAIGNPAPGSVMANLYVAADMHLEGRTIADDRAPDSDFGRDFVFPGSGTMVELRENHTTASLEIFRSFNTTTDQFEAHAWAFNGSALDVVLAINGTGNITAVLLDGAGSEHINGTFTHGTHAFSITEATAGDWRVNLTLTGFNGTFAFLASAPTSDDPVPGSGDDPSAGEADAPAEDGNGTEVPTHEDTPAVALPLLVVGLVWLARRR